jgi:hypothetical protein
MHFVFGSITTAFAKPVCPGRPRALRKKGRVDGRIRSDNRKGNNNEAKREAGKGLANQSQTGMGQEYICFFDAETLRQRARKDKRLFGCLFLILCV